MSKYDALGQFLRAQTISEVPMTFGEIQRIVGTSLPPSAHNYRPWWSNNPSNSVMTKVWLDAGFRTEQVDMEGKRLVFRRMNIAPTSTPAGSSGDSSGMSEAPKDFVQAEKKSRRHPLFGALKGTFTIEPGYDLTQPAMPEWADMIDEKYGPETRK
ncbi:MAG: hypothetical protein ABSD74_09445 [Rhizomicrobium sp.]|jgi:hypothetical protein